MKVCLKSGMLQEIVTCVMSQENACAKKEIQKALQRSISKEKPIKEIIGDLCVTGKKYNMVNQYIQLFSAFTLFVKSKLVLNKIQEFCYVNQNFLKWFNKIVRLYYKTDMMSQVIQKWYKDSHQPKGWAVFMAQMKKVIEWL